MGFLAPALELVPDGVDRIEGGAPGATGRKRDS